jgi:hypothetical protein
MSGAGRSPAGARRELAPFLRSLARRERSLFLLQAGAAGGLVAALLGAIWLLLAAGGGSRAAAVTAAAAADSPLAWIPDPAPLALALLVLVGGAVGAGWAARQRGTATGGELVAGARVFEAGHPGARNLVRTAAELLEEEPARPGADPPRIAGSDAVRQAIVDDAAREAEGASPRTLLPAERPLLGAFGALALGAVVILASATGPLASGPPALAGGGTGGAPGGAGDAGTGAMAAELTIVAEPPAWVGGASRTFVDPDEVELLEGGRLRIQVDFSGGAPPAGVQVETVEGVRALEPVPGEARWEVALAAEGDGFLAFEALDAEGTVGWRHLAGLLLRPDQSPVVRIVEPGRDLRFAHGDQVLEVVVEATDDHALAELELVYTRVSGFGELFEFEEGEIPLQVERHGPASWTGRATWSLAPLTLDRGESVVYHARARDRRPGAEAATSETWMVEVLGGDPGSSGGFASDDELSRYALSQQMVNVMMERLEGARDSLSAEDFLDEVMTVAAAQRRVRAEFIFMLGGELADDAHAYDDPLTGDQRDPLVDPLADPGHHDPDHGDPDHAHGDPDAGLQDLHEEAHARADQDAAEGRLAQQGRQELSRAVMAMSRVATFLLASDLPPARDEGQVALEHLQRAFSASRYILRAMTEREELDLARRLTGVRVDVLPDRRAGLEPPPDPHLAGLREVLAGVAQAAGGRSLSPAEVGSRAPGAAAGSSAGPSPESGADPLVTLASRLLALAPTDPEHRALAGILRDAAEERDPVRRQAEVTRAFEALSVLVRARMEAAPEALPSPGARRIRGALGELLPPPPASGGGRP